MNLTGLHILLTYCCAFRCGHCFVWGSPEQPGVFTLARLHEALDLAHADACHLCFSLRQGLRPRFAAALGPDPMYAEAGS